MAKTERVTYLEAVRRILEENNGGPLSYSQIIEIAVERGWLRPVKSLSTNLPAIVKRSGLFDTSVRGQVSLPTAGSSSDGTEEFDNEESAAF